MHNGPVVFSLYRSYLRQVTLLPHNYLRQFFRIKAADDFRSILGTTNNDALQRNKVKRVTKDLHKLKAALRGNADAFEHILDLAYGRKGRLRWEIMKPLLSDPRAPPAARIIPNYERSRPPVYSPELTALLTSIHSRTTKPLDKNSIISPPVIPPRADPLSEEAQLLGPFSKRREVNLLWRYFKTEWKKVLPPLQVSIREIPDSLEMTNQSNDKHDPVGAGVRSVGLQDSGVLEEAQKLAGPAWKPLSTPRRARQRLDKEAPKPHESLFESGLPTRWLRKRYQDLLGRVPILTYCLQQQKVDQDKHRPAGHYKVSLAPSALSSHIRYGANRLPPVDESNLSWIQLAEKSEKRKTQGVMQKQKQDTRATNDNTIPC
ncbi:hypothetical protein PILCRDRAFT_813497 [Piloderma croceum F 1598]|uniref:LYR motif-containing protein Cup1-like N-terminal domain-containing protein n=1 Tax=Piloderma croceum (strain F 1598) TaxID=765440 RepID=A0A0C3CFN6_PILCF|nr:hypothetical protein PILCRDRAFT_813497 [Piloderma croceum F 1598]